MLMKEAGTLRMDNVQISDVAMGVEAIKGNLTIKNGTIGFNDGANNYGVKVGKLVESATLTNVTISGGGNGKGVYGEGAKAVTLTKVDISNVSEGVWVKGGGTLTIKEGSITFKSGKDNYGIGVGKSVTSATLDRVTIAGGGDGKGVIMEGTKMEMSGGSISNIELGVYVGGAVTNASLTDVNISQVEKGVLIKKGNL
ncbi:hypothetical protein, partial [Bartonella bovis]|uniref:hypothetical protein n=1 Tax=Bartonella bovis TaxID=155194 RepID=UPI0011AFD0A6